MTKLNWTRVRRERPSAPLQDRPKKDLTFSARYAGTCSNCHGAVFPGNSVRYNRVGKLVHGHGCPAKTRRNRVRS